LIDRLDEVVADVGTDGFLERRVLLALGDHHDREVWRHLPNLAVDLEPTFAGHLFIQQQNIEGPASQQLDGVVRVARPLYGIAF
jgi:hypothetical protein